MWFKPAQGTASLSGQTRTRTFCLASPIRSAQEAAGARSLGSTQHTQEAQCLHHTHGVHGAHGALSPVPGRGGFQGGPSLAGLLGPQTVGGAVPSCTPAHGLGPREKRAGHWGRAGSLYEGSGAEQGRVGVPCRVVKEGWGSLVSWYIREVSPRRCTVASEMAGCLGLEFPPLLPTPLPWEGVELVPAAGCGPPERGRPGSPSSRQGGRCGAPGSL